jgi:transcriptional regulator with XRE-family HTH domain
LSSQLDRQSKRCDTTAAMDLLDYLKRALRERGWSMTDLARRAGVSKQAVSGWLSEDDFSRLTPGPTSCRKIAKALEVDPDFILTLAGHRDRVVAEADDELPENVIELRQRTKRLEKLLSPYPRAFWVSVLDATEKMAEFGANLPPEISKQAGRAISKPVPRTRRVNSGPDGKINAYQLAPTG